MKFSLQLILFLFPILVISCKKDPAATPPSSGGTFLDKEVWFDSTSGSESTLHYSYNSVGDLISITSASPNGGDTLFYDAPGKLSKYKAGNAWEAVMIYDTTGRIVRKKSLFLSPQPGSAETVFNYDDRGRVIADSSYDDSGNLGAYNIFSYDNNNNLTSYQRYWIANGAVYTGGLVSVTYDGHLNPHAKFGKWVYYGDGDFKFLFIENSISERNGSVEEKVPPDLVYKYYSDGQLWQASSVMYNSSITYYYK